MKKNIIFVLVFIIVVCFLFLAFKKNDSDLVYTISLKYSELNDYLDENNNVLIYITNKNDKTILNNNIELVYMYLSKTEENDFVNKYGVKIPILAYFSDGILIEYTEYNGNIEEFLKRNGFLE